MTIVLDWETGLEGYRGAYTTHHSRISLSFFTSLFSSASSSSFFTIPLTDVYIPGACPTLCSLAGPSSANWTNVHSVTNLLKCDEPLLFDLKVQNQYNGRQSALTLRACIVEGEVNLAFSSQDVL